MLQAGPVSSKPKPDLDKEGKKATYQLKEKIKDVPVDKITFVKIDKYWYLQK